MLLERYEFKRGNSYKQYEFYSDGPKGRIRKIIFFSYLGSQDGWAYYNLGFGDYDPKSQKISDLTLTGNKDRDKVLATVAAAALEFTERISNCRIVIAGSTPSRIRLYQMKIAQFYPDISELFDIQCQTAEGDLTLLKRGENYCSFIFQRKT